MKKKVMSVFFQLAWAALLVISLLYPARKVMAPDNRWRCGKGNRSTA